MAKEAAETELIISKALYHLGKER